MKSSAHFDRRGRGHSRHSDLSGREPFGPSTVPPGAPVVFETASKRASTTPPTGIAAQAQAGHSPPERIGGKGRSRRTTVARSVAFRRLLSLEEAAHYLGLSFWSFRELVNAGDVPLIRVPRPRTLRQHKRGTRSQFLRRTLVDARDLDALVDRWREESIR